MVHPSGTPIIHSIKDGATICFPGGLLTRPVKLYSKPSRYAARSLVLSQDSLERRQKPSGWVNDVTVGVGNNEYPLPMVRGAKGGSGYNLPLRIIPDLGQVAEDDVDTQGKQPPDIFDDDVFRAYFADEPCVFEPQAAARTFFDSCTETSRAYILTRKTAAEHVHGRQFIAFQLFDVLIYGNARPVFRENRPAERVDFAKPLMSESRPLKAEIS